MPVEWKDLFDEYPILNEIWKKLKGQEPSPEELATLIMLETYKQLALLAVFLDGTRVALNGLREEIAGLREDVKPFIRAIIRALERIIEMSKGSLAKFDGEMD